MQRVLDSIEVFFENLAAVDFGPLGLAVVFHTVRAFAVSRAWRNVIADAYPDARVRWRSIYGSYLAGVGVNALVPARAGDGVRLYLAKHRVDGATYTTLGTTLVVMSIFDFLAALGLFLFAVRMGVFPSLDVLPNLPSFEFAWLFEHPRLALALGVLVGVLISLAVMWATRHVRAFKQRVRQGFTVLRDRRRYLRRVAAWQAVDWGSRLATTFFFLDAFDIATTVRNAFVAQAAQSLATALPISPGGIGPEQALLLVALAGEAARSDLVAFTVGMKLTVLATNVALGFAALLLMTRSLRWRELTRGRDSVEPAAPE